MESLLFDGLAANPDLAGKEVFVLGQPALAALGDMREDGTLVYLWLRPMDRWAIVVGAWVRRGEA